MDLGTIRTKVRRKLDETSEAFWSDDELNDYINQAYRYYWQWMIQAQNPESLKTTTLNIVSGTAEITCPSDMISIRLLERIFDTYTVPLTYYERFDTWNYTSANAAAGNLYTPTYRLSGNGTTQQIILEPTPQFSETGGLKLTYFFRPTELSSDGSSPLINAMYHDLLVCHATVQAKEKEEAVGNGGTDSAPFVSTMKNLEQMFRESIERTSIQRISTEPYSFNDW